MRLKKKKYGKPFWWLIGKLETTVFNRKGSVNMEPSTTASPFFSFLQNTTSIAWSISKIYRTLTGFTQSSNIISQPLLLFISAAIKIWFTNPSLLPLQLLVFHFWRALGLVQLSTMTLTPPQPSGAGEEAPKQILQEKVTSEQDQNNVSFKKEVESAWMIAEGKAASKKGLNGSPLAGKRSAFCFLEENNS